MDLQGGGRGARNRRLLPRGRYYNERPVSSFSGALDLLWGSYRTFVVEARFGFNRMTLALFVTDLVQALLGAALGVPLPSWCCG